MAEETMPPDKPSDIESAVVSFPLPLDSHVLTFQLERSNLRGRVVRLARILDEILTPHAYHPVIESLVVENIALSVLLSSMLKYEGIFILQAQGDGPVTRLVCDVTSRGEIRATAGYSKEKLDSLLTITPSPDIKELFGHGYLAFTVDQGEYSERYQGIVELQGRNLQDSIHHYFMQSEQIGTAIKLAIQKDTQGKWRAGGVMLQHMPDHSNIPQDAKPISEDWNRCQILLATCKESELLDGRLHDETLLFRLFHEEGVRVYTPHPLTKGCRCSQEKLKGVLSMLSQDDLDHAAKDGKITMTCEFCNKHFDFVRNDV